MTSSAMSASAAFTMGGAALLYFAKAASRDRRSAFRPHYRVGLIGLLATLGGCTLGVVSRGWGVGLMSSGVMLMLTLSSLALAVPLWPRASWSTLGIVVTALLAHALSGA